MPAGKILSPSKYQQHSLVFQAHPVCMDVDGVLRLSLYENDKWVRSLKVSSDRKSIKINSWKIDFVNPFEESNKNRNL